MGRVMQCTACAKRDVDWLTREQTTGIDVVATEVATVGCSRCQAHNSEDDEFEQDEDHHPIECCQSAQHLREGDSAAAHAHRSLQRRPGSVRLKPTMPARYHP